MLTKGHTLRLYFRLSHPILLGTQQHLVQSNSDNGRYKSAQLFQINFLLRHLEMSFNLSDGKWELYVNGKKSLQNRAKHKNHVEIPEGGELVLGQASRESDLDESFDTRYSYIGSLSFMNIYNRVLKPSQVSRKCAKHLDNL